MPENNDNFDKYTPFFSASSSQLFLQKCYTHEKIAEAEIKSYDNCYPFIYHLEHAKTYYNQAAIAPLSIQPILTFYGFAQLLKACLLTIDPNYPESTSMLAHGVTTRKKKKQQYEFLKDEVKTQKNGLFTCIAEKLFHIKHLEGEKFSMGTLIEGNPRYAQTLHCRFPRKISSPCYPLRMVFNYPQPYWIAIKCPAVDWKNF